MTEAAIDAGFSAISMWRWESHSAKVPGRFVCRKSPWFDGFGWGMLVAFSGLVSLIDHRYRRRVRKPESSSVMAEAG